MNSTKPTIGRGGKPITNLTCFFRHNEHTFKPYAERVLPDLVRRVREPVILSAPCSTGQEAHSIAAVNHRFGASHISVEGIDISPEVLDVARVGTYEISETVFTQFAPLREYPQLIIKKGTVEREVTVFDSRFQKRFVQLEVADELREGVSFSVGDIINGELPRCYDVIFCMNFLDLLEDEDMGRALDNIVAHISEGGYLVMGDFQGGTLRPEEGLIAIRYPRLVSVGEDPQRIYQKILTK